MHSPLEIAKNFVEIGIHKVRLSAWKMVILGFFAGCFIGFAGIASTIASATIENASVARLLSACVFPADMAMVLVAGSELFTGNNLIVISVLQKRVKWWEMLKNWFFVFIGNFLGASFIAFMVVYGHTQQPEISYEEDMTIVNPGSISYPRQDGRRPSYVVVDVDPKGDLHFNIVYL